MSVMRRISDSTRTWCDFREGPLTDIARHIRNVSSAVSLVSLSWLKALGTENRSGNWSNKELDKRFRPLRRFGGGANPCGKECRAGELPGKRAKDFRSRHRHDLRRLCNADLGFAHCTRSLRCTLDFRVGSEGDIPTRFGLRNPVTRLSKKVMR
jgi:hypothetical protein